MQQLGLLLGECVERGLGVWFGTWGEAGGWMPLTTRPQRYCDPASLVFENVPNSHQTC